MATPNTCVVEERRRRVERGGKSVSRSGARIGSRRHAHADPTHANTHLVQTLFFLGHRRRGVWTADSGREPLERKKEKKQE